MLLPDHAADGFVDRLLGGLTGDDLGAPGLILIYPVNTDRLATPLFAKPAGRVVFLVALLRFGPTADSEVVRTITANRRLFEHAVAAGGVTYPTGAIPVTAEDWSRHFGPLWTEFAAAKNRYDSRLLLNPGQGIF
jgi:FAD/FMN-containing dehydrogenase